jgi:hypothetical protein
MSRLQIATEVRAITLTIALGEEPHCVVVEFAAEVTQGRKGLRIKGSALNGLLSAELTHDRVTKARTFNLQFDIHQWAGKPLLGVPNFLKLEQVARTLSAGTPVKLHVTSNGQEVEVSSGTLDADDYHQYLRAFLRELGFLRKLDKFFKLNVTMPDDVHDVLRNATSGRKILALLEIDKLVNQEFRAMVVPTDLDRLLAAVNAQTPGPMALKQKIDSIQIFGKSYGPFETQFTSEHAVIAMVGPANIEVGKPLEMSMRLVDGHHWVAQCTHFRGCWTTSGRNSRSEALPRTLLFYVSGLPLARIALEGCEPRMSVANSETRHATGRSRNGNINEIPQ